MCLIGASLSAGAPPFSLKRFEPDSPSEYSDLPAMIALCLVSDQTSKFSRFIRWNFVFLSLQSRSSCVAHVILVCVASWDGFGKNQLMLEYNWASSPKWSSLCPTMLKILSCEFRNSRINCLSWKTLFLWSLSRLWFHVTAFFSRQ